MKALTKQVVKWAKDRKFFDNKNGTTFNAQFIKLYEEYGELCNSYSRGKDIRDDIGDNLVVLIILFQLSGLDPVEIILKAEDRAKDSHTVQFYTVEEKIIQLPIWYNAMKWNKDEHPAFFIDDCKTAVITLAHICFYKETTLKECLQIAYDEIKDRNGKFINRTFVKENDLLTK